MHENDEDQMSVMDRNIDDVQHIRSYVLCCVVSYYHCCRTFSCFLAVSWGNVFFYPSVRTPSWHKRYRVTTNHFVMLIDRLPRFEEHEHSSNGLFENFISQSQQVPNMMTFPAERRSNAAIRTWAIEAEIVVAMRHFSCAAVFISMQLVH